MPIVLREPGEVRKLLTDEARCINRGGIRIAEQEGGKGIAALCRIGQTRNAGLGVAEAHTAGLALPSESVIVIDLKLAAEFEGMRTGDPGKVVVVGIDRVLRPVIC